MIAKLTCDAGINHFFPLGGPPHEVGGKACWCEPHIYRFCTQCGGEPDCWLCQGSGIVRIGAPEIGDRLLVVHHYIPDDAVIIDGR